MLILNCVNKLCILPFITYISVCLKYLKDLFQFGDQDGKSIDAKLQHPMGICVLRENILAVADSYNHKVSLYFVNT